MNLSEYESLLAAQHEVLTPTQFRDFLVKECLERMRVNLGLITENDQLKRRIQQLEEGKGERQGYWYDPSNKTYGPLG